jgi:diacylglycerol O-acyltransferase/trehalose O-mycolyltransferase
MLEASCFGWDSTSFDGGADPNQAFNANSLESTAFKSNAFKSNKDFQETYPNAGGSNAAFQFPPARGAAACPQTRPDRHTQRLRR